MQKINDAFSKYGSSTVDFIKEIKELVDITAVNKFVLTDKYTFMSVLSVKDDLIMVVMLNREFISLFNTGAFFTMNTSENVLNKKWNFVRTLKTDYFTKNFAEEKIKVDDLIILDSKNRVQLIADEAYRTMLVRFNLNCDGMLTKTLCRNVMIAERMYCNDISSTVVTRCNERGYEKVMAVLSDKYTNIPQTILADVITELESTEKLRCMGYYVDNRISQISLGFSDKEQEVRDVYKIDDAVPGIYLATSDTGDCSITAKAYFQFRNSKVYIGEVTRRHEGNIDKNVLLDDIRKTLFPMYTEVPDKLVKLMTIDIDKPEIALKKALKHVGLVKLIGKKNEMAVSEQLISELSPAMQYTAYDIAMMCLQIAERIQNLANDTRRKLEHGIIKVIDCDFTKLTVAPETVTLAD